MNRRPHAGGQHGALVHDEFRELVIAEYRDYTRNAMLNGIVMFGGTDVFQAIASELAFEGNMAIEEATALLWPECHAMYRAAEASVTVVRDSTEAV